MHLSPTDHFGGARHLLLESRTMSTYRTLLLESRTFLPQIRFTRFHWRTQAVSMSNFAGTK